MRFRKIHKYHLANTKQYAAHLGGIDHGKVIGKSDYQIGYKNWISLPYRFLPKYKNSTSGSSGIPLIFVKSLSSHLRAWLFVKHSYRMHDIRIFKDLEARFYGRSQSSRYALISTKIKDVILRRRRFSIFNLEDSVLWGFLRDFKMHNYVYLNGYTSSLVKFAEFLIKNNLVLQKECPSLKLCIVTSEMCSKEDKITLAKGFGVRIVREYGAAEVGIIAFEDSRGDWIINDYNLKVEVVDENDAVLSNGGQGRIVVTDLYNKAMPIIRYDTGDIGVVVKNNSGKTLLKDLIGRTNDFAILKSGRTIPGLAFYYVTKSLLKKEGLVQEVIVKQKAIDLFIVIYRSAKPLTLMDENKVVELFTNYLCERVKVHFLRVERIERSDSGKLRQFERIFN